MRALLRHYTDFFLQGLPSFLVGLWSVGYTRSSPISQLEEVWQELSRYQQPSSSRESRPLSKLSFWSKEIAKIAAGQMKRHLETPSELLKLWARITKRPFHQDGSIVDDPGFQLLHRLVTWHHSLFLSQTRPSVGWPWPYLDKIIFLFEHHTTYKSINANFHQKPLKCWHQKGNPKRSRVPLPLDYPFRWPYPIDLCRPVSGTRSSRFLLAWERGLLSVPLSCRDALVLWWPRWYGMASLLRCASYL